MKLTTLTTRLGIFATNAEEVFGLPHMILTVMSPTIAPLPNANNSLGLPQVYSVLPTLQSIVHDNLNAND